MLTMQAKATMATGVLCAALNIAACNTVSAPTVTASPAAPIVAAPEPPSPGVVGAAIGQTLDEKDRATAIATQQEAVSSGARKSWRGEHGAYGFVVPGPDAGACRDYTHKIFINGRPQEAKGQACRQNGEWRVTS